MLDLDWIISTLKEAVEEENWDLVREILIYLEDDVFEQYKEDEDWWKDEDED